MRWSKTSDFKVKTKLGEYLVKSDLLYTRTDEWIKEEGENVVIGITDYAQKKLKYIVNVELPEVGSPIKKGDTVATLESVKSVADVYSPVEGEVVEVNEKLTESPEILNKDPYGGGWIIKLKPSSPLNKSELLTPEEYVNKIRKEET